jgi:hypothetical protein
MPASSEKEIYMHIILSVSLIGSILCFVPHFLGQTTGFTTLGDRLGTSTVERSFVATIGLVAPVALDTLLDMKSLHHTFTYPRIMLLSALLIPATINLVHSGNSNIYLCSAHSGEILFVGSLLSYLAIGHHESRFTCRFAMAMATAYTLGILLNNFSTFDRNGHSYHGVSLVVTGIAFVGIFVVCALRVRMYLDNRIGMNGANYSIVYVISLCCNILGKWIAYAYFNDGSWADFTADHIATHNYIDMITVLISATFPGRIARQEAIALKVQSLYLFILKCV